MKEQIQKVIEFYEAFHVPYATEPTTPSEDRQLLRWRLMNEELSEVSKEMTAHPNMSKLTKELCDLIYVVAGTIIEFGLQNKIEEAFDLVHRSNMSKLRTDGTPIIREDGKILKSENYFEPDLTELFDDSKVCSECGGRGTKKLHTCPYKQEINDDCVSLCNCCENCIDECLMEYENRL